MKNIQKAIRCGGLTFMTAIASAFAGHLLSGEGAVLSSSAIAVIGGFLTFAAVESGDE